MLATKRLSDGLWGAFDDAGKQILAIKEKSPECQVCQCLAYPGRGKLLVEFFGPGALPKACEWAEKYRPPAQIDPKRFPSRGTSVVKKKALSQGRLAVSYASRA
jgi:hypothetical protein